MRGEILSVTTIHNGNVTLLAMNTHIHIQIDIYNYFETKRRTEKCCHGLTYTIQMYINKWEFYSMHLCPQSTSIPKLFLIDFFFQIQKFSDALVFWGIFFFVLRIGNSIRTHNMCHTQSIPESFKYTYSAREQTRSRKRCRKKYAAGLECLELN